MGRKSRIYPFLLPGVRLRPGLFLGSATPEPGRVVNFSGETVAPVWLAMVARIAAAVCRGLAVSLTVTASVDRGVEKEPGSRASEGRRPLSRRFRLKVDRAYVGSGLMSLPMCRMRALAAVMALLRSEERRPLQLQGRAPVVALLFSVRAGMQPPQPVI